MSQIFDIVCSSAGHAARSAQPDWQAKLGTADRLVTGMLCGACARLDPPDPKTAAEEQIVAAIAQAIPDMAAVISDMATLLAQPTPAAGTLSTAQLSIIARQHDTALRTVATDLSTTALRLKQLAKLLNGDFSSAT